ncbi:hypothetical protein PI125_g2935 [Phytophthora idaei]|nr:hypothetical protein PI125_g2935 [Phytophthora idaei]
MPKRVSWRDMVVDVDVTEADAVAATLKPFNIDKSQTRTCTIALKLSTRCATAYLCAAPKVAARQVQSSAAGEEISLRTWS